MKRILCSDSNAVIPPEYFAQGKAVFCGGRPYMLAAAQKLNLRPDGVVPPEYAPILSARPNRPPSVSTHLTKKQSIRKLYCADTFEFIPPEFFADGKAVWSGGKPYLAIAAQRRGLKPDASPPPVRQERDNSPLPQTPPPFSIAPPPLPPSIPNPAIRVPSSDPLQVAARPPRPPSGVTPPPLPRKQFNSALQARNAQGEAEPVTPPPIQSPARSNDPVARVREQMQNVPWTQPPRNASPTPIPISVPVLKAANIPEYVATLTPTPEPTPAPKRGMTSIGLVIGQKLFNRYDVKKILGKGAMGEVLHVTDLQSHMEYALKRLPPGMPREKQEAMRRNFHLTCQLTHPHIATTRNLEIDPKNGNVFILMDLVRGQDMAKWLVAERLKRGKKDAPLPIELVIGIAEQIASALDYAHRQPASHDQEGNPKQFGILHRDLKPANVMIEQTRQYCPGVPYVRLVDFGLATESQGSLDDVSVPQHNKKAGTPVYMAPEQWEGRTLTRGVDQWALAVILYELLAGVRPFWDDTEFMLMQKIFKASPPCPATLSPRQFAALQKTFNPDRRQRHHSCLALVKALAGAEHSTRNLVLASEFPMPEDFGSQDEEE